MRKGLAFLGVMIFGFLVARSFLRAENAYAAEDASRRQTQIKVTYTEYEWWLLRWADNELICQVFIDHDGLPVPAEVYKSCGLEKYMQWLSTGPCLGIQSGDTSSCPGLYAHFITSQKKQRTITVDLPLPSVWVTLIGCTPKPLNNYCSEMPSLLLIAEEPLPNQYPTAIHGVLGGQPFACPGAVCVVPLSPTSSEGAVVDFWTDSSYGDSSEHYHAKLRILDNTNGALNLEQKGYYMDILTTQWRGDGNISGCSECWQSFPAPGASVNWLADTSQTTDLNTDDPLIYLAGRLIASGIIKANDCPSNGLLSNGWANACGIEKTRDLVSVWQNKFNEEIIQASEDTGIPAHLLKNMLTQESQFWPGAAFDINNNEYGLGRQTELGSDTLLLIDNAFYEQFCPLVLEQAVCSENGYINLSTEQQAMLRGALALSARSDCVACPAGIDVSHIGFNINLVAQMLKASCEQTGYLVSGITGKSPGDAASYEDLWRFTLTSYHAGPGCLQNALNRTIQGRLPLTWTNVSGNFDPGCSSAINFVERISDPGIYFSQPLPSLPTQISDITSTPSDGAPTLAPPTPTPTQTETPVDDSSEPTDQSSLTSNDEAQMTASPTVEMTSTPETQATPTP